MTDPQGYFRSLIEGTDPKNWKSVLAGLDPQLAQNGFQRAPDSSRIKLPAGGGYVDVVDANGGWAWRTMDSPGTVLGGARGDRSGDSGSTPGSRQDTGPSAGGDQASVGTIAVPRSPGSTITTPTNLDSNDPYKAAYDAMNRQRKKAALGGRASTILAGFGAGAPTTRLATLLGA